MTDSTLPAFEGFRPWTWYQAALQNALTPDASQEKAMMALDELWEELMRFKRRREGFLGHSLRAPVAPRGLYLWGGVGRGKSMLMDVFYGTLPFRRKRRVHFHAFMAEVHALMQAHKGEEDPLKGVASEIARQVRVLCFDEFHVSDIADAMILGRLLTGLFDAGVVLVATSNYAPADLYPEGQNRSSFLPTIALIQAHLNVVNVDGGEDFRQRALTQAAVFYIPVTPDHEKALAALFAQISADAAVQPLDVVILGRTLKARQHTTQAIWFDFDTLCNGPRSQNDYLYLAQHYAYVFVSAVPILTPDRRDEARRLTLLVDVLYDNRIKLAMTLQAEPEALYPSGDFASEFVRTASRLTEMRSEEYLRLPPAAAQV